jgi:hypothetical protein
LTNQDFVVSGTLTQGPNIGASSATVTGQLTFVDPVSGLNNYPCFSIASVNGTISGNSVLLQLINPSGATVAQIGEPAVLFAQTGVNPVTVASVQNGGSILNGTGPSYLVASKACGGSLVDTTLAGDFGNICLGLNNTTACQHPLTLSPAAIVFPAQVLNSAPTSQTITLSNNSAATVPVQALNFSNITDANFNGQSDFNGLPSFTETDACGAGGAPSLGNPFDLVAGQSCLVTVTFVPQEGCPWLPFPSPPSINGAPPEFCPYPQGATVTATLQNQSSTDSDKSFAVPVSGTGVSAIQPSVAELDFGAEEQLNPAEASLPQVLSLTNASANPVEILGRAPCTNATPNTHNTLPSPRLSSSPVAGLQVVSNDVYQILADVSTTPASITYRCDSDGATGLANFQISSDACSGTVLAPQASCSLEVTYVPQPNTNIASTGLDYFLELNTVQCYGGVTSDCEIDSGRFPVELKSNGSSPLRMSPGAGLNFGVQKKGTTSAAMTVTIQNDPNLTYPNCQAGLDCSAVTFVGQILASGSFAESDDCPATLAQGASCTINVTFAPGSSGFTTGNLTMNYTQISSSGAVTTGNLQKVYLRGTGQ